MSIILTSSLPSPEYFKTLRDSAGWGDIPSKEAETALKASLGGVSAYQERDLIGMARFIGDGVLNIYIQDVVVAKPYRGHGLGRKLILRLLSDLKANVPDGCSIGLMAAKGQEKFYEQFGFIQRPSHVYGAGMFASLGELSHSKGSAG